MSEQKNNWPDEVRLEMVHRSEFYENPSVYQYGYYDGYQKALAQPPYNTGKELDRRYSLQEIKECFGDAGVVGCNWLLDKLKSISQLSAPNTGKLEYETDFFKGFEAGLKESIPSANTGKGGVWRKASEGFFPTKSGSYHLRHRNIDGTWFGLWAYIFPDAIDTDFWKRIGYEYLDESISGGDGWIEFKEGQPLPDYDVPALWLYEDGKMNVDSLDKDGNPWLFGGAKDEGGWPQDPSVTHWRPLPPPPVEQKLNQ